MALNLLSGGNFRDCEGNPLADGTLEFELSHDEQETATPSQVVGGLKRTIYLDNTGNVASGQSVEANDAMNPSGSYYIVMAYRSDGTRAWKAPQYISVTTSPSPFNLSAVVPSNPPAQSSSSEGSGILLQTNGVTNSDQALLNLQEGTNVTISNSAGTTTINASGGGGFAVGSRPVLSSLSTWGGLQEVITYGSSSVFVTPTANNVQVALLTVSTPITISTVTVFTNTIDGSTSGYGVGIYTLDGNTKLVDGSNIITANTAGAYKITFTPVSLAAGSYWFAQTVTATGFTPCCTERVPTVTLTWANLESTKIGTAANQSSSGALPTTLGTITALTSVSSAGGIAIAIFE